MKDEDDQLKKFFTIGLEQSAGDLPDFDSTLEKVSARHFSERRRFWLKIAAGILLLSVASALIVLNQQKQFTLPANSITSWSEPTRSLQPGYTPGLEVGMLTSWKSPTEFLLPDVNKNDNDDKKRN